MRKSIIVSLFFLLIPSLLFSQKAQLRSVDSTFTLKTFATSSQATMRFVDNIWIWTDTTEFTQALRLKELTVIPGTPESGIGRLYVKDSDSDLYFKNDGGTETSLTGAGAGGQWTDFGTFLKPSDAGDVAIHITDTAENDSVIIEIDGGGNVDFTSTGQTYTFIGVFDPGNVQFSTYSNDATPNDTDEIFVFRYRGNDAALNNQTYADMRVATEDVTTGDLAAKMSFRVMINSQMRSFLILDGYNGTVDQGEIIFNEFGDDVDIRMEGVGAANAFLLTGSTGDISMSDGVTLNAVSGNTIIGGGTTAPELRILEASGSGTNYTSFTTPALAANVNYTLPPDDGDSGEVLQTNGTGTLTWETDATGGSTVWSGIGDPSNSGLTTITFDNAETSLLTGNNDAVVDFFTIQNTDADHANNMYLLNLDYSADDGDTDADFIKFQDSGSIVMTIQSDGQIATDGGITTGGSVGIGTTSPGTLLDVQGAAGAAGIATLSTAELTVVSGDILGSIYAQAPLESSGTDAILVSAAIDFVATATFAADNDSTDIVFRTGQSETATEKMRLTSGGRLGIGTATPLEELHVVGEIFLEHTATASGEHAFEVTVDADGKGDVKAVELQYDTGAISTGDIAVGILIEFNEIDAVGGDVIGLEILSTDGGADNVVGIKIGAEIAPLIQDSGSFINPTLGTNNTNTTNVPDMIDGSTGTNTTIFAADNDFIIIGANAANTQLEFVIETGFGGPGIQPVFAFSTTGTNQFTNFSPTDGTDGFKNAGAFVVAWDADEVPGYVADDVTGKFDIRITRTANPSGSVSLFYAKTAATRTFEIDKSGNVRFLTYIFEGATDDAFEHTLNVIDPTADRLFNFPDDQLVAGDVLVASDASDLEYLNLLTTEILIGDGSGIPTAAALSGDVTMTNAGVVTVADDSHAHTTTTLSGIDISDDTNLSGGTNATLNGDAIDVDDAFLVNNAADEMLLADGTTNVVTDILDLSHTGGTVAAGFGTGIRFDIEDAGGIEEQASIDVSLDVVTDGAEEASIIFRHNVGGAMQESMRIDGTSGFIGIGTNAPAHNLHIQNSTTDQPNIRIENTNDDAVSGTIYFIKDGTSPADADRVGRLRFQGDDSGGTITDYATLEVFSDDITDTDEGGRIKINVSMNATMRNLLTLDGYNGTVDQGEIIFNEDGQDVDIRMEGVGAANAFVLTGSSGDISMSQTLTVPTVLAGLIDPAGAVDLDLGSADVTDVRIETDGGVVVIDGSITQDAGTTLFMGGLLDATGAVDMDYGSGDITDHTFSTDGTGDSEIVLPTGSIGSGEILDGDVSVEDVQPELDNRTISYSIIDTVKALDLFRIHEFNYAITIDSVVTNTDAGTHTFNIEHRAHTTPRSAGTDILTADIVADAFESNSTFDDATIPANRPLYHVGSAVSGGADRVDVTIFYKID